MRSSGLLWLVLHVVKLLWVKDPIMCPVVTLQAILKRLFRLQPSHPVFILDDYSLLTQGDLRKCLSSCLRIMELPLLGPYISSFWGTMAYDVNISLMAIKLHGVWNINAIWSYISDNTAQALQVHLTFQKLVNSLQQMLCGVWGICDVVIFSFMCGVTPSFYCNKLDSNKW